MIHYSLIIPCYNEAKNLPALIHRCNDVFVRDDIEIIMVDNGSTDCTPSIFEQRLTSHARIRSIRLEVNKGYGAGILAGLKVAKGKILAWTHADLQTDPADLLKGFSFYEGSGCIEAYFIKGKRYGRRWIDNIFTIGMALFETLLLRKSLWEINAQPTIFHRSLYESWTSPPTDYSLDLYAYYQAKLQGLTIKRFPVYFAPRLHGHSHWNVGWRGKARFIKRTLQYSYALRKNLRGRHYDRDSSS